MTTFEDLLTHRHILALAPMDGYTDQPFRRACKRHGAQLLYSEFINGPDVIYHSRYEASKIRFTPFERPFGIQLYDHDIERLAQAAQIVESYEPDFIDINLGCSIKEIKNRGAGAGLMREPARVGRLFEMLANRVTLPVTAKIRLGWSEHEKNYREIVRILESNNVRLLAVHARTADQSFSAATDPESVIDLVHHTALPVLYNGNITQLRAMSDIITRTPQVAGVMIGRAAIGNPWVFSDSTPLPEERYACIAQHFDEHLAFYGTGVGIRLFRKHMVRYLAPLMVTRDIKSRLLTAETPTEVMSLLQAILGL